MIENTYKIFDLEENKLIFVGTTKECAERLGTSTANVCKCCIGKYNLKHRYRIYGEFEEPKPIFKATKPKKLTAYERELQDVISTINQFGNCLVVKWKDELLQDLSSKGYKIRVEEWIKSKRTRIQGQPKVSYIFWNGKEW